MKELIKELSGLCFKKQVDFSYDKDCKRVLALYDSENRVFTICARLDKRDSIQQLQAAIDKVRAL